MGGLGLVGAGTNNSRIAGLRLLMSMRDPRHSLLFVLLRATTGVGEDPSPHLPFMQIELSYPRPPWAPF